MPTSDHKRKSEDPKVSEDTKRRKINDVDSDYSSSGNESDLELGSLDFLNKPPQILKGILISCTGKLTRTRDELARLTLGLGGTFTKGLSKKVNFLVASEEVVREGTSMTFKLAVELKIPIVKESYLDDSIKNGKLLPFDNYTFDNSEQTRPVTKVSTTERQETREENGKLESSNSTPTRTVENLEPMLDISEAELLTSLRSLFSVNKPPTYYDVVINVEDKSIYCIAGLLTVRSEYFAKLIAEARKSQKMNSVTLTIDKVSSTTLIATVQYLMTATLSLDSVGTAINVIKYSSEIGCEKIAIAAKSYLETIVNTYVQQNDMFNAFALYNMLKTESIDATEIIEILQKLVKKSPLTFFQDPHFLKLSPSMMADFLKDDELSVDEVDLFERLLEWGVVNLLAEQKEPSKLAPSESVYCLAPNNQVTITKQENISDEKYVSASDLRNFLSDLLPLIRYEHVPTTEIFKKLDSKKLFTSDELLQFFKAAMSVKQGEKYTIMGIEHAFRKKRVPKLADVFDFYVSQTDLELKSRVVLPHFVFCGTIWFVVVMKTMHHGDSHLSFYLYNKIIAEGGVLSEPITTSITFRLLNRLDTSKNKRQKFTKTWKDIKAWGYSNVIKITELFDPANGWLEPNGTFRLQVGIALQDKVQQTL